LGKFRRDYHGGRNFLGFCLQVKPYAAIMGMQMWRGWRATVVLVPGEHCAGDQ
jgi:hypothetical protein